MSEWNKIDGCFFLAIVWEDRRKAWAEEDEASGIARAAWVNTWLVKWKAALEAKEAHIRLGSFAEDWDAPGMEAYDNA